MMSTALANIIRLFFHFMKLSDLFTLRAFKRSPTITGNHYLSKASFVIRVKFLKLVKVNYFLFLHSDINITTKLSMSRG